MKNFIKKFIAIVLVLCLCLAMAVQVFAKPDKDNGGGKDKDNGQTGVGQTAVHIHQAQGLGSEGDSVTISFNVVDENGQEKEAIYTGTIQGSKLTIDMENTENYFDLSNGPINATFVNNSTEEEGVFQITGKEGNDTAHGGKAQDKGLNNFNA